MFADYDDLGYDDEDLYLEHHGILGMKWGVRRFQNADGSLTPEGQQRYAQKNLKYAMTKNLDKWGKDRDHNVLYLTGPSGSGKSTTALSMSNKNDSIIHLDTLFENTQHGSNTRNKEFESYCESKGIDVKSARNLKLSRQERRNIINQVGNEIEPYGRQCYDNGRRVIVEGVQLADDTVFPNKSYFKDKPLVALRSGKATSALRAALRDKKKVKDIIRDVTDKERSEWYDYIQDNLKQLDSLE